MFRSKKRFYVRCRGRVLGPLSIHQLEVMERRGELTSSHEVSEDRKNWGPLEGLEELFPPPPEDDKPSEPVKSPEPRTPPGGPPAQRPLRRRRPFRQAVRPVMPAPVGPGYAAKPAVGLGSAEPSGGVPRTTLSTQHAVAAVAVAGCLIVAVVWSAVSSMGDSKGPGSAKTEEPEGRSVSTTAVSSYSRKTEDGEIEVGISSESLDAIRQEQVGQKWCWAACIQIVLRAHGFDRTQTEIVRRTFGDSRDEGATLPAIASNLEGWTLSRGGESVVLSCKIPVFLTAEPGGGNDVKPQLAPGLGHMIEQLKQGRPLIIAYHHPDLDGDGRPDGGHAVVITAVKYRKNPGGQPTISEIVVRDPSGHFSRTRGRRVLRPDEYRNCDGSVYVIPIE